MKKYVLTLVVLFTLLVNLTIPRQANAGVGALIAVPAVVTVGAITGGTGLVGMVVGGVMAETCDGDWCSFGGLFVFLMAGVAFVVGLVILDDNSHNMELTVLTPEQAARISVTDTEMAAYNSEINEINAIKETIQAEVASQAKPDGDLAHQRWMEMRQYLSPESFSALEKISKSFIQTVTSK